MIGLVVHIPHHSNIATVQLFLILYPYSPPLNAAWAKFVAVYSELWVSHTLAWLSYSNHLHVVYYEDLQRNMFIHLRDIVLFLGLRLSVDRLLCVESQREGGFRRSGLYRLGYDPFTAAMRTNIDYHIKRVDLALRAKNLSGVPDEYHLR